MLPLSAHNSGSGGEADGEMMEGRSDGEGRGRLGVRRWREGGMQCVQYRWVRGGFSPPSMNP